MLETHLFYSFYGCELLPGILPGDASMLCIPSCDFLLPHISRHLILHQNLERTERSNQEPGRNAVGNYNKINSFKARSANVLFLVKAHPEPESQVCESLDHSPHTVFGMEGVKSIQSQYFDHNKLCYKLNYYR